MTKKTSTSPKFKIWLTVLAIGVLAGLITEYKVLTQGLGFLGTNDIVVWTFPISIYLFFALTSTGLTFLASMPLIFGFKQYDSIAKKAVLLGIGSLFAAFTALVMDLGTIGHMFNFITSPNFASPMWWMGAFYTLELIMLVLKLWRMQIGDTSSTLSKVVGIGGFASAIAATITLGLVFGSIEARPTYLAGFAPVFFLVTAFLSGLAFFLLFSLGAHLLTQTSISDEQASLFNELGKILGFATGLVLLFFVIRMLIGLASTGTEFAAIEGTTGELPFQLELWLGFVLPFVLMLLPSTRSSLLGKLVASALVLLGLFIDRVAYVTIGQLKPLGVRAVGMPELISPHLPSGWEWVVLLATVSVLLLFFTLGEKYLKLDTAQ